jgi:Uncharacterized protein family, UPF0114
MATQGETPTTGQKSVHVIEYYLENSLFSLRWLLVPLYVGLGLLLILFSVYFFRELLRLFAHAATGEEVDLILGALTLVDLTLVGSARSLAGSSAGRGLSSLNAKQNVRPRNAASRLRLARGMPGRSRRHTITCGGLR